MPTFDGNTYDHEADHDRLAAQLRRVYLLMLDDEWHTLAEIARRTNDPQTSVSSRLRDLRKEKFGAHTVERRCMGRGSGLYEYHLIVNDDRTRLVGRGA